MIDQHLKNNNLATLLTCEQEGVGKKFGGVWTKNKDILGFGKTKIEGSQQAEHFTGFRIFSDCIFDFMPEKFPFDILLDVLVPAIRAGEKVQTHFETEAKWFETGDEKSYLTASFTCLDILFAEINNPYSQNLKEIFKRFRPEWDYVNKNYFGPKASLNANKNSKVLSAIKPEEQLELEGHVVLSDNISFSNKICLENVVIINSNPIKTKVLSSESNKLLFF